MTARSGLATVRDLDALWLTALIWFLAKFVRYSFPPLFETFSVEYGASNTTLGLLFSALMLTYAAMQFPSGALADRIGAVRIIAAGAVVVAGATFLLFSWPAFPVLVVAMVLIGAGTGVHKTVAIDLLSTLYPERTGRTLGIMDAIGALGGVVAPAAVVFVLSVAVGWSALFAVVAVAAATLAVAFYAVVRRRVDAANGDEDDGTGDRDRETDPRAYLGAFADYRFVLFVVVVVAYAFAWSGTTAFLPLYLTDEKAMASGLAGVLYSALFVVSLVQPITGTLSDRVGELRVMAGTLLLAVGALAALVLARIPIAIAAVVPLLGIGGHGFRPVRDAYLVRIIPSSVTGGTLGIVRTVMMGVGAVAPSVVGYLSETAGFRVAFGTLAGVMGVGAAGVLALMAANR